MIWRVTKKNARRRAVLEFVDGGGREERVAKAPEGAKMRVGRGGTVKKVCGSKVCLCFRG